MKKNGFTLAEVLITLAIIGVVATMTLPALMTNTAEQQAKTALKKGINTLTEAAQMNEAVAGFNYASMTDAWPSTLNDTAINEQSLFGILANRTAIDYRKSTLIDSSGAKVAPDKVVYFQDGTALLFKGTDVVSNKTNAALQPDGLPLGIPVIFDTNGAKGPNILSNCTGTALGADEDTDANFTTALGTEFSTKTCGEKAKRVIKDQFRLRLRGGIAQPSGAASEWTFSEAVTKK